MFHHSSSSNYLDPIFPPPALAQSDCFFDLSGGQMPAAFFSADPFSPSSSLSSSYYHGLHRSNSALSVASDMANAAQFYNSPHHYQPPLAQPSSSPSSSGDFLDFYDGPVRRVFSTGDLQGMNGMPPSGENGSQESGSSSGKVGRYTAEERREKIDKYRSKRNQRNFHKKITYACRKTLADSRPRVRGRFARNGESEMETEAETSNTMSYYDGSQYSCSSSSGNNNNIKKYDEGERWQQMKAALGTTEEEDRYGYDEELLATFVDVFSMNLLS